MTPTIEHNNNNQHVLQTPSDIHMQFDTIVSTGNGYWELKHNDNTVATVSDLSDWPSETVQTFRAIQFGEEVIA